MADVISRLKLDSGEFDSKIKRAGQELLAYSEHCRNMGLEMGYANKDAKEFAKALGDMKTVSQSARGKLNELTEAFVNLKTMYNGMTDAEKQNTFGKELAASLDKLKTRIDEAKQNLNSVNAELGNTKQAEDGAKSGLEGLTSALGINLKSLAGWGTALAAGKAALDVAKDAFFASESSVDEWGRTVAASQSLYEGFLTAINNGDISGYLSNIDSIVKAARLAYDELDKLGTMETIQAPQISKQQLENERIRSMIQTGRYIAPQDGRRNAVFNGREMQTGDKLTAGQIRALEKQLQGGMQKVVKLVGNEVDQTGKAINAYYDKLAKTNGMSFQEFKKGTSSWAEFNKRMQGYEQYKEWDKQARTEFAKQGGRGNVDFDKSNPFAEFRKWGTFRVDKEEDSSYKDLVNLIRQRDQKVGQVYSTQAQSYRTMNRAEGFTVSKLMGNGGNGGNGGKTDIQFADDSIMAQEKLISDLTQKWKTASGELREGYLKDLEDAQKKLAEMTGKAKVKAQPVGMTFTAAQLEGMSFDNQIPTTRGNNGRAQDKLDLATAAFATGGISNIDFSTYISGIKNALSNANLGDELYNNMTEKLKDATTVSTLLQEMMERGLAGADLESTAQALKEKLLSPEGIDQTTIQSFLDELNKQIEEAGGVGLKLNADTGEVTDDKGNGNDDGDDLKKFSEGIGKLAGGLSQVTGGLKAVGVEIPKEVDQVIGVINGVSQIISGVGTIISIFGTSAITANTTAVGVNTAAIGGLIAALEFNSATNFFGLANGGIVPAFAGGGLIGRAAGGLMIPGNSMSGDRLRLPVDGGLGMIGVNSGELILNRAQQGNLASQLEGGVAAGANTQPFINGEMIYLGLQAYMRRSGLGEIVTSER